jgi:SulP family sulfate permease
LCQASLAILQLIAYGIFGTSMALAVGPVAVVPVVTAAVGQVAVAGTAEYLTAAITLAFLSGLILIAMSVLRRGFLWRTSRPHMAIVGLVTGTKHFRNVGPTT